MDENELNWLRLLTWVVMDGTVVHRSEKNKRIQFKLSKDRKINSLRNLLDKLGLNYTFRKAIKSGINKLQPYYICLYGDAARAICYDLLNEKLIPNYWINLNKEQTKAVVEVISETDGLRRHNKIHWFSTELINIQNIERMCKLHNFSFNYKSYINRSGFSNGKLQYLAKIDDTI